MKLSEQYRPQKLSDVVGQTKAVRTISRVLARGWGGRAWWITGASGTGKTTLAKIIAGLGAHPLATNEYVAGTLNPAAVKEIEASYRCRCLPFAGDSRNGHAVIVNEAHGLAKHTVRALLDVLERLPEHVCWLFTTTSHGQRSFFEDDVDGDAAPLVSRCEVVALQDGEATRRDMAKRAKEIAKAEGMDGLPDELYLHALNAVHGNMRALLQRVESGQLADEARAYAENYLHQPLASQEPRLRKVMQEVLAALKEKP